MCALPYTLDTEFLIFIYLYLFIFIYLFFLVQRMHPSSRP